MARVVYNDLEVPEGKKLNCLYRREKLFLLIFITYIKGKVIKKILIYHPAFGFFQVC